MVMLINIYSFYDEAQMTSRFMIVNCEAKKKQAVQDKQVSYLHVHNTTVKFVNAENKPP